MERVTARNMVSCNGNVCPLAVMPDRPTEAENARVKGYDVVLPKRPEPVSPTAALAVVVVVVVFPARLIRPTFKVVGAAGAPATWT